MLQVGDGVKKWAVLAPTAALPRAPRIATRRHFLARLELAKARRTGLLIVGHPKSGNTWLRVMLSRLYQVRHGLPASLIVTSDELARRHPAVPRISATNGHYSYEGAIGEALAPDAPDSPLRHKPIVFLARNPCDIAVSWYFQFTRRQSAHKQELINAFIERPIDRRTVSMWDFVRHSDIGLPFLIDYLNGWERNVARLDRAIMVRCEDLSAEPAKALRRITDLLGESFSDQELEEAVSSGSFDHLRELESKGIFRQGGLTLRNPKDFESFKVRRAKVGGYRDYFTPEQAAELEDLVISRLSPIFGYFPERARRAARVAV
ncbi:MAG: sulfotransferase domain-containing protein [Geminicoccales bacterium]